MEFSYCGDDLYDSEIDADGGEDFEEGWKEESSYDVGGAEEVEDEENPGEDGVVEGVLGVGAVEEGVEVFEGGEWEADEG